jgi:hypothetical protein
MQWGFSSNRSDGSPSFRPWYTPAACIPGNDQAGGPRDEKTLRRCGGPCANQCDGSGANKTINPRRLAGCRNHGHKSESASKRASQRHTHTNIQPELLIFTAKHYSLTADTAAQPRPTEPVKEQGKPTVEELQARWGPFAANAGTYELSGDTLTRHVAVAKNAAAQGKVVTRATIKLEGNNLWVTPVEGARGKVAYPATIKYVRVE